MLAIGSQTFLDSAERIHVVVQDVLKWLEARRRPRQNVHGKTGNLQHPTCCRLRAHMAGAVVCHFCQMHLVFGGFQVSVAIANLALLRQVQSLQGCMSGACDQLLLVSVA